MAVMYSALAAALVGVAGSVASAATTTKFKLGDHPDGATAPPIYGLRLDGLFTGAGNDTTFSFNTAEGVFLTVTDIGGALEIHISGVVQLVEGFGSLSGDGRFAVDFTYRENVALMSGGWGVSPDSPSNNGTLTALDASGDFAGMSFDLVEETLDGNAFKFAPDGHRLVGDSTSWVGRGWLIALDEFGNRTGEKPQDWLFTATLVPLPSAAGLGLAGLAGLGLRRRRA